MGPSSGVCAKLHAADVEREAGLLCKGFVWTSADKINVIQKGSVWEMRETDLLRLDS